jgi:hypothetical protein
LEIMGMTRPLKGVLIRVLTSSSSPELNMISKINARVDMNR